MLQQKNKKNLFSDIVISITKFEDYEQFAVDKIKNSLIYALKILVIFAILISIACTLKIYSIINNIAIEIEENIDEIKFEDGKLSINSNEPLKKEYSNFISMNVIVDTSDITEEKEQEYIEEVYDGENGIVLLQDKAIVKNVLSNQIEYYDYKDIIINGENLEKQYLIESLQGVNLYLICVLFFIILFFIVFVIYGVNVLMYIIIFAFLGNLTSILLKMPLKYKATFNISTHALTLPIILNLLYIIINLFLGFEIKYFQIMYIGIAYVYIITAILMIKTDFIKRQIELSKIIEEQQKIRREKKIEDLNSNLDKDDIKSEEDNK